MTRQFHFVILIFTIFCSPFSFGAANCQNLFQERIPFYNEPLFLKKLQDAGYKIEDSQYADRMLSKKISGEWVEFGSVTEMESPYLFEWATKKDHDFFIKHGIDQPALDEIISDEGQALGKGYYVSTHPIDSRMFGDYLTIFKLQKPLRIITSGTVKSFANDEATIRELAQLGFDGVGANRYLTWFSIISKEPLVQPMQLTEEPFDYLLKHYDDEYNSAKMVPENNFIKIFQEKRIMFAHSPLAKQIANKIKSGIKLSPIEKKFQRFLEKTH